MSIDDYNNEIEKKFSTTDSWRLFRIISEFVEGFETMTELGPSVSIFGSARIKEGPIYDLSVNVGEEIAKRGFAVITGGGPGTMEAANFGAQKAEGKSCGLCVDLPHESAANPYVDNDYLLKFRYFFIRKVMFIRYAQGYVFLPGGYGSMDELFEALTLIQTKKIHSFPIYLVGKSYWGGLIQWIKETVLSHGCISESDLKMMRITDDPKEVADGIEHHFKQHHARRNF